jgi:hypothetical protein
LSYSRRFAHFGAAPPGQKRSALSGAPDKAHGRRQFVEIVQNFPSECRYVLEMLGRVYGYDAEAREQQLRGTARLEFHQRHSGPVMEELHRWLEAQFSQKKTEPNSSLGQAITYLLRHWKGLTAFLRLPNAPVDNNIVIAARGNSKVMPTPGLCRVEMVFARFLYVSTLAVAA